MINDVYLYFSDDITATKASTTTADQLVTVADGAPFTNMPTTAITVAEAAAGKGWFHNGLAKLTMDAAHNDASADVHLFGTHYGTVADDAVVLVSPYAISYAEGSGDGDMTLRTVAQDAVYGITQSSTAGENGFTLTLLKPYEPDQALVKAASTLLSIEAVDASNTLLTFPPTTHDTGAQDKVTITHTSGANRLISKAIAEIITDPRNQGKMIKFADAFNEKYFGSNPAGMNTVTFAIDAA
jgi:hypothetical protein